MSEDKNSANFEEQIKKLEHLVAQLETGNLSLEDSIKAYEEGVKIAQNCQMTLKNAEQKVEILTKQGEELVKQDLTLKISDFSIFIMNEYFENHRKSINNKLDELLPKSSQKVGNLFSAMRYSMLNGGKRIRPLLCIAAADSISSSNEATVVAASAIEMMHVYSLIHDDLPSMDNDDLRRGIASCHIKYNEATAILAGDALQALAFETLSNIKSLSYENHLKIIKILSNNIGCSGMVKGQALDLDTAYKPSSREELDEMHRCKTGALIEASVLIGAITTQEMTDSQEFALKNFAQKLVLPFR